MLERVVSLPALVVVAYALFLCALLLFSLWLKREGTTLRRELQRALSERERG